MVCTNIHEGGRGFANPIFLNEKKGPSSLAGVQKTILMVVLALLTPTENLQTYMKGIVAIEILFAHTPSSLSGVLITIFMVVLGFPTPKKVPLSPKNHHYKIWWPDRFSKNPSWLKRSRLLSREA